MPLPYHGALPAPVRKRPCLRPSSWFDEPHEAQPAGDEGPSDGIPQLRELRFHATVFSSFGSTGAEARCAAVMLWLKLPFRVKNEVMVCTARGLIECSTPAVKASDVKTMTGISVARANAVAAGTERPSITHISTEKTSTPAA